MQIHLKDIPNEVIIEYFLLPLANSSGYVYVETRKGMYGLKEAGIIAYNPLVCNLQPHGYASGAHTPGLWFHTTLPITFTLALDDFVIKFFAADDATHLLDALRENYSITVNPYGIKYCGLTIKWNCPGNYVNIFMTNSVHKALECFQNPMLMRPQHSPHKWLAPKYRAKEQYSPNASTAPNLDKRGITLMQSISGTFLYIARAVDPTMLVALNKIGAKEALPTTDTIKKKKMLMDYVATQPDTVIRFHAIDMCLHIDSNATYLVQRKEHSCDAGHYYLSYNSPSDNIFPTPSPTGPILTKCQTIRIVMASAAVAESVQFSSMSIRLFSSAQPSPRWATRNLPPQSRATARRPTASALPTCTGNDQRPLICDSTGCADA